MSEKCTLNGCRRNQEVREVCRQHYRAVNYQVEIGGLSKKRAEKILGAKKKTGPKNSKLIESLFGKAK